MTLLRSLAVSALALASGCALVTAVPPEVEVAAVELRAVGLLDQVLRVTLCVSNPNQSERAFRSVDVSVEVGGAALAAGRTETAVLLPPLSSVTVPFAITTTARNIGPQLLAILKAGGGIEYRLSGSVSLAGSLPVALPFSRTGRLDLLTAGRDVLADGLPPSTRCATPGSG